MSTINVDMEKKIKEFLQHSNKNKFITHPPTIFTTNLEDILQTLTKSG